MCTTGARKWASSAVVLGDRDHEAQVRFDHLALGVDVAELDELGEFDLLAGGEQRDATHVFQEELKRIRAGVGLQVDPLGAVSLIGELGHPLVGVLLIDELDSTSRRVPVFGGSSFFSFPPTLLG